MTNNSEDSLFRSPDSNNHQPPSEAQRALVFLSNRIYALGARPGTVRKEILIQLPERTPTVKRQSVFHDYRDELMDLLRGHAQEAVAVAS